MLRSQIEIEWKCGIVGMLINLWCCILGIENLEQIIIIMKYLSSDASVDCPW
jgi:hypothetical protein